MAMKNKSPKEDGKLTILYRAESAQRIPIDAIDLSTVLDNFSFHDYYCPCNTTAPLSEYDSIEQIIEHFDGLVSTDENNGPTRKIQPQDILLITHKDPPRRQCHLLLDRLDKKDYTQALRSCEPIEELSLVPRPISKKFHELSIAGNPNGYDSVPDIIESNLSEHDTLDPAILDPSYNLEPDIEEEHELYIISAFELVWPDEHCWNFLSPEERTIIAPLLNHIHIGTDKRLSRLDSGFNKDALKLETLARDLNQVYSHLVAFAWIPGYPSTIAPILPKTLAIDIQGFEKTIAEFWDIYSENQVAIDAFQTVAEKAEKWATEQLDCATQRIWDSQEKNLYMPVCFGKPR